MDSSKLKVGEKRFFTEIYFDLKQKASLMLYVTIKCKVACKVLSSFVHRH